MKRILILLLLVNLIVDSINAQLNPIPEKIDFQAIARNAAGVVMGNQDIGVRMAVIRAPLPGTIVYEEEHQVSTDQYGQFVLPIGTGTAGNGIFREIDWSQGPYFVSVAVDVDGGSNYVEMGAMEMMTVPYAFYAKHAENVDDADADPRNEIQQLGLQGEVLSINGGNSVRLPDASNENELQTLAVGTDNVLSISRGNSVQLPAGTSRWKEKNQSVYLESGRVGIGLSTVPHTLTLFGQNQSYLNFLTSATEVGQENGLVVGLNKLSNSALFWNYEQGDLRFGTNDETRMYINQFGRVGIGTTAAGEKLEVGSRDDDVGIRINAGENKTARLSLMETAAAKRLGYSWEYDGDDGTLSLRSNGYRNDADDKFMTFYRDGLSDVGIKGTLNMHSVESDFSLLRLTNENYADSRIIIGLNREDPVIDFFGQPLSIKGNSNLALTIDTHGNVGIGKDDPEKDLDVEGNAEVSENLGVKEDLFVFENAEMLGTLTVGAGATFDQIDEYTGTTGSGLGNKSVDFSYPDGYTQSNTRVLSVEIQVESGAWVGTGGGYTGYSGITAVSRDNSVRKINATLYENVIRIWYPARDDYQGQPFRMLLLRLSAKR